MSDARVSALFIHPIKGAASVALESIEFDALGAVGDRRWMLVDETGVAITQREAPKLAQIAPLIDGEGLVLRMRTTPVHEAGLRVSINSLGERARDVIIWDDTVRVRDASREINQWCSDAIEMTCSLVHIDASSRRPLLPKYAGVVSPTNRIVALTDGAPMLLLGEGSLSQLNAKLVAQGELPLAVERFRPNVLLAGTAPHEEDSWRSITIGAVDIGVGSLCPRCIVTTTDQHTGERGKEPLRTLATYRKQDGGVMFGANATNATPGTIYLGDRVIVHELKVGSS